MKLCHILLASLICLSQASISAGDDSFRSKTYAAKIGFLLGYTTGLIPVAGQAALLFVLACATDDPGAELGTFAGSAAVGHTAGLATLATATHYAGKLATHITGYKIEPLKWLYYALMKSKEEPQNIIKISLSIKA